jgi:hypothetical protein
LHLQRVLVLLIVGTLVAGCTVVNPFRNRAAEERAASLLQVQLAIMRFADEYSARVTEQVGQFQQSTTDPAERLAAQSWLVSQATSAFTIAAGPNPELNAIDMLVFATLSRMVIEDRWVNGSYGPRADGLLATHRSLENRVWQSADLVLTPAQTAELRTSIETWHEANPLGRAVPFIHLQDFALAIGATRTETAGSSGSIFSFLGIDPLANLDPAVRELAQSRQLAERAVYWGQRAPKLISMETQRLSFELAMTPESERLLQGIDRVGGAAQTAGDLVADLPRLIADERSAAIEQLTDLLYGQQEQVLALTLELRAALEAGGTTSDSVRETIAALDALLARFDRPEGRRPDSRPFDVTEYTEALRVLGESAQRLQVLFAETEGRLPAVDRASERAATHLAALVDHVFWRLVQLLLVLVAAVVAGALCYRAIARRTASPARATVPAAP